MKKWKCTECGTVTDEDNLLIEKNPFAKGFIIQGCPTCFSVNSMTPVCDEYGCEKVATFGYPTDEGYRNTCGEHMRKYKDKTEEITEIHRLERKIKRLESDLKEAQTPAEPKEETQVTQ